MKLVLGIFLSLLMLSIVASADDITAHTPACNGTVCPALYGANDTTPVDIKVVAKPGMPVWIKTTIIVLIWFIFALIMYGLMKKKAKKEKDQEEKKDEIK